MFLKNKVLACLLILAFAVFALAGCGSSEAPDQNAAQQPAAQEELEGKLVVYHAGSLTIPFEALEKEFETMHPKVDIQRTAGGSAELARKVTELGDKVDVLASADYKVVETLMMPEYAKWNAVFAENAMVLMYSDKSKYADEINSDNWYEVLLRDGVNYGHSEPDLDPCGYRAVLLMQLAEKHYGQAGLADKLVAACPAKNIRPKSVELIAMLETGALDYAFEYESVALQHAAKNSAFKYVSFPDEVNMSALALADFYKDATIELKGKEPGQTLTRVGEPIVYSLTIPSTATNSDLAVEFLKFFFDKDKGLKILEDNGQPIVYPVEVKGEENLPEGLKEVL